MKNTTRPAIPIAANEPMTEPTMTGTFDELLELVLTAGRELPVGVAEELILARVAEELVGAVDEAAALELHSKKTSQLEIRTTI